MEITAVLVPGQRAVFAMGSDMVPDENPRHDVVLTVPYLMGKYEVTNRQISAAFNWALGKGRISIYNGDIWDSSRTCKYLAIARFDEGFQAGIEIAGAKLVVRTVTDLTTKEKVLADEFPVCGISWYGACAFCNFASEMEGLSPVYNLATWECAWAKNGYRLPTEAEWLYAARGKTNRTFAWGVDLDASYCTYGSGKHYFSSNLTPVGFFNGKEKAGLKLHDNASPFGLYDMTGNLWEWCWDWYGSSYFSVAAKENPRGPKAGDVRLPWSKEPTRVWKGGGNLAPSNYLRLEGRWSASCSQCYGETGFRVARTMK